MNAMFTTTLKIKQSMLRTILSFAFVLSSLAVWAQPTFNSAVTQANYPNWVDVTFNTGDNMTTDDGGTGFIIKVDGVSVTIAEVRYTGAQSVPDNQLWFRLAVPLKAGQTVTIEYDDSGDTRENSSGNQLAAFGAQTVTNNVNPVTLSPTHNATNVNPTADFTLDFNGTNVQANTGNITIRPISPTGADVTIAVGDAQVSIVNDVVTINPTANLDPGTQYEIFFADDVFRTTSNGRLAGIASGEWQFTTGGATITGFSPTDGATGIAVFDNLQVTFSDNVTANTGNIVIRNTTDGVDEHTISIIDGTQISISNNVLTIDPATDLNPSKDYEVTMGAGTLLKTADGMIAAGIATTDWNFTTAALPAFATTAFSPVDGAADVAKNTNITITYNASIVANTGNVVIRNTTDGVDEHTISITDGTQISISNNVLTIDPATDLNANKDYEVTMLTDVVRRASDNTAAPALVSGDLNFSTAITITGLSPTNTSTGVVPGTTFSITFDTDIAQGGGNIQLVDLTNGGSSNINVNTLTFVGNTATFTPTLTGNTQYEIIITSGKINASGGAGSTMPTVATGEWVFTTASSVTVNTLNPTHNAINIAPGATNLNITYSANVQAGSGNIVLTNLTDGSFENIDVTGGNIIGSGGTTITIVPPTGLTANKLYEVTIPAGAFVEAAGANAPIPELTAGNWRFTTKSAIGVNTLSPTHNGIDVATTTNLVINFSSNVQAGSGNIVVTPITPAGTAQNFDVNTLVTISGSTVTVPNVSLNANTLYEVTFVDGVLRDAAAANGYVTGITTGNWRFTTVSGITGTPTTPADNATDVALNVSPLITYTADIQKNTTGNVTITPLNPVGTATVVPITDGSITIQNGNELLISLASLNPSTEYQITIDDGALKAANQAQAEIGGVAAGSWTFTTLGGVTITAPNVDACVGGGFTTIDPIVITEGSASSFAAGNGQTLILSVPSNYTMEAGTGSVIVTGSEISNASVNVTANQITVQYDIGGTSNINSIVINGLKIRADNAGAGNITNSGTGTAVQQGNNSGTVHAILTTPSLPSAPGLDNTSFTFCQNTNINAQTVTASGGGTYTWYANAALTTVLYTGATPNLVTNLGASSANVGTTTYYVTRDNGTCVSTASTVSVTINALPIVSLISSDADNVICEGETVTFTAISTPSAGANYVFKNGTTELQNSGSNTYSSNTLTSGNITVEVTVNGCTTTSSIIAFTANALPDVGYSEPETTSFPNDQTAAVPLSDGDAGTPTYGGTVGGAIVATTVGTYSGPGVIGSNFYPDVAGDGDHIITYAYTDPTTGCPNSITFTYNVFNPNGSIVGLNNSYCVGDAQTGNLTPSTNTSIFPNTIVKKQVINFGFTKVTLTSTYTKTSVFAIGGTGVIGSGPYRFDPTAAGAGKHRVVINVLYNYTSGDGPLWGASINKPSFVDVTVSPLPVLVLDGLNSQYCTDINSVNLDLRANGTSVTNGFTVKYKKNGGGEVALAANVKVINPATLGAGSYEIFFDYTDPSTGCSNTSASSFFNIYDIPVPSFTFPSNDNTHCVDVTSLAMVPRDGGTVITGTNLTGVIFEIQTNQTGLYAQLGAGETNIDPSVYGVGDHNVRMIYTNANGCQVTTNDQVLTVYALPVPSFTFGGSGTSYCENVTSITMVPRDGGADITGADLANVVFAIDANSTGAFVNQANGDLTFDPNALGVGTHQIRMTYTNTNGCVATTTPSTITVLPLPDPNFAESNLVYCADVTSAALTLRDGANNLITTQLNNANIEVDLNSSGTFGAPPAGSIVKNITASSVTLDPSILGASVGGNPHLIRFTYTDGNGCVEVSASLSVTVNALPAPNFTLASGSAPFIYCVDAAQQELSVRDATATLSAAELANARFEIDKGAGYTTNNGEVNVDLVNGKAYIVPSILGVSSGTPHLIRFTYTNANGCEFTSSPIAVTINALPQPEITGIVTTGYCVDLTSATINLRDNLTTLTSTQLSGGRVTFEIKKNSGSFAAPANGEVSIAGAVVSIHPDKIGVGNHELRFTYSDDNTCVQTSSAVAIVVHALPDPNFTGLSAEYCVDNGVITFVPRNGTTVINDLNNVTYSINTDNGGWTDNPGSINVNVGANTVTFDPAVAGEGTHQIRFTYTDANGCEQTSTPETTIIHPLPQPNFSIAGNVTVYCVDAASPVLTLSDDVTVLTSAQLNEVSFQIDKGQANNFVANSGEISVDVANNQVTLNPSILGVGTHDIRYQYKDGNGCVKTSTEMTITINPLPQPEITGVVTTGYCVDLTSATINLRDNLTALTATQLSGGRVTFEIKKNSGSFAAPANGEVSIAGAVVSIHPDKIGVGNHELRFTYTDNNTCVQTSSAVAIVVHDLPDPNFTGLSTEYCVDNGVVTFVSRNGTTVINDLNNVTYSINTDNGGWTDNPGSINVNVGANTVTFDPAVAGEGTHQIRFTYTDVNGCEQTSTPETTVIHPLPQPNFSIAGNVTVYCVDAASPVLTLSDDVTVLTSAQLNEVSFQIDKGQANNFVANSGEISVDVANNQVTLNPSILGVGTHDIRYQYKDGNGCVKTSAEMTITINPLPQPNITGVVTTGYCVDLTSATINLRDNLTALTSTQLSGGRVTFEIKKNSGSFATPANGEVSIAGAVVSIHPDKIGVGNHELRFTYTDNNTCVQTSDAVAIVVHDLPDPNFTGLSAEYCVDNGVVTFVSRNGTTVINDLNNVTYSINTNNGGWVDNPGSINVNVGANTVTFNPATAGVGTHQIRFTYTDVNGCVQTSTPETTVIHALPQPAFTIAGSITEYCRDAASPALTLTDATTGTTLNNNAGNELDRVDFYIDKGQAGNYVANNGEISILPTSNQVLLNPAVLGVGTHNIYYVYTNANTCVANSNVMVITIHELPSPVINSIDVTGYCESETSATLTLKDGSTDINITATNVVFTVDLNQSGTFATPPANSIIPNLGGNTVTLNPSLFPVGIHKIRYTYTDGNSCVSTSSEAVTFEILKLPTLTFTGLDATYCNDVNSVQLRAFNNGTVLSPPNGAFKISTDNVNFAVNSAIDPNTHILDPTKLTPGIYWIRYDYTDGLNCANISASQQVEIFFYPSDLDFTFNNTCFGDDVAFTATATGITTGWKWEWTFGDGGTSNIQNPTHKYPTFAGFQVTLTATNQHGCQFTVTKTVTVTPVPTADFGSAGFCLGGTTQFTDQSTVSQPGKVVKWNWDFGDGTTSTLQNPTHVYGAPGTYTVTLNIETQGSVNGCVDQISKTVYIFPYVTVSNTQNYFETFDAGDGGWIPAGTNSSWQHGTPSGSTFDATSGGVWATNLSGAYNNNEVSYVESPCFNIDNMLRPVINLRYWVNTDVNFDGAVLLATLDDGVTWEVVGKVGSGIAWYNKTGILGNPGTQSAAQPSWNGNIIGWAGDTDTTWSVAKFPLDEFKARLDASTTDNLKTIRFRIAFGSDASNPIGSNLDGFAFDNVLIGERNRVALLEHFTNSSNSVANTENDFVNNFTEGRTPEVVNIQYHTKFPGEDVLNNDNNAAPSARALYYGVAVTPRTALDGSTRDSAFSVYGQDDYSRRTLEASPFSINLDFSGSSPTTLSVKATVNALNDIERPLIVHIVVIEREIAGVGSSGLVFKNVVKKMLPSAAGTLVDWTTGKTSEVISQSWELANVYDNKQIGVVVFVQDDETKEIYQAAIGDPSSLLRTAGTNQVTSVTNVTKQTNDFVVYPNPAITQVYVGYKSQSFTQNTPYIIYDQLGKVVASGIVAQGKKGVVLDTNQWAEGVYYVEMTLPDDKSLKSKLVKQ
jgi:hypothetical protein